MHELDPAWRQVTAGQLPAEAHKRGDEELDLVVKYLAKNFGPKVSVNKADASDLVSGLSLSEKDAGAIVSYRKDHGNFKTLDDLKKVPGVDAQKLDSAKDRIMFD